MIIKESEKKYIIQDTTSEITGNRTILLRHDTPFSVKKRLVDRANKEGHSATLYSDNRIEDRLPEGIKSMEKSK
jgi:hypothetical protein